MYVANKSQTVPRKACFLICNWRWCSTLESGRFDTKSFRYKLTLLFKSFQYRILHYIYLTKRTFKDILTRLPERTQTSVVNKTNPYLCEPPHIPKSLTHWEHANETKFWLSLFIENRDLFIYLLNRKQQITTHIKDKN